MKKQLLSFILLFACTAMLAQTDYQVSTKQEKKKALLEEFTGQGCYWCRDGHVMANQMLSALEGNAYCIAIHTGSLSGTFNGVNLQTAAGDEIGQLFDCNSAGFPSGMINRHDFNANGVYTLSRSLWLPYAEEQISQDAIVNLYQHAVFNGETRQMTVRVEGYFTGDPQSANERLTVMVTQDNIVAYQNGGGDDYVHNHVLRATLSEALGDKIENAGKGQFFVKEYVYDVPEDMGHTDVLPEDFTVIAFVAAGNEEIQNVTGGKPEYINYGLEKKAELLSPQFEMGTKWGYNFFDLTLRNKSAVRLTSATFDVTVNGETTETTIDCDVDQFDKKEVRVPAIIAYADKGKTAFSVVLKKLNGEDVDEVKYEGSFQKPKISNTTINIQIMTDNKASQNHFYLKDANGNVIREFGPYADGEAATYYEQVTVDDGATYCIEVTDYAGDGMQSGSKGGLIVKSSMGSLIDQFYQINGWGVRSFFIVDNALGIEEAEIAPASAGNSRYTLDGKRIENKPQRGIYIENGKKIAVK